ncbi:hypothetical protein ABTZ03_29605 [Kitasatospora sp. NPDC096077]|uniref:hypothetical protein n=1 Tax=Kitasatospora sp. NPDC096077 TaxID=3155544 RepID=UPI00333380D4
MDFTSGGTAGPRLDTAALARLHLGTNIWGSLPGAAGAQHAAELFHRAGWRVRRSSWTEFEVENAYAELELTPLQPVLVTGFVDPDRLTDLLAALRATGLSYRLEYEDPEGREHLHHSPDQDA